MDSLESQIKEEEYFYNYDYSFLASNAKKIRADLSDYESKIKEGGISFKLKEYIEKPCVSEDPFKHISLNAYLTIISVRTFTLFQHCFPYTYLFESYC